MILREMWRQTVERCRGKDFLFWQDRTFSYGEFDEITETLAMGFLDTGIQKGDSICAFLNNGPEIIQTLLASAKIGAIFVPVNVAFLEKETSYIVNNCNARMIITESGFMDMIPSIRAACPSLEHVVLTSDKTDLPGVIPWSEVLRHKGPGPQEAIDLDVKDIQILLYTSGTTGNPKGVMCQQNYWHIIGQRTQPPLEYEENDRMLVYVPLFHNLGLHLVTVMVMVGGSVILVDRWHPTRFWEWVREYNVNRTFFLGFAVYTLTQISKKEDPEKHPIKKCMSAVRGIEQRTLDEFYERFRIPLLNTYGLTEFPYVTNATYEDSIHKPNTVGKASAGLEMKLVDDRGAIVPVGDIGEIQIRGESGTLGYYNDPENTELLIDSAGWYHTGDLAYMDQDGYYFFADRKKDMLRRSGENISSAELEGILIRHVKIVDAAVIGVPDKARGQEVKAYIVPEPGSGLTPDAVWAYCDKEMAGYKVPRYIEFRDSLPKTRTQKTRKFMLRKEAQNPSERCFDRNK